MNTHSYASIYHQVLWKNFRNKFTLTELSIFGMSCLAVANLQSNVVQYS